MGRPPKIISVPVALARALGSRTQRWKVRAELLNRVAVNEFEPVLYDELLVESVGTSTPVTPAMADHMGTIFADVVACRPRLIVELGTRGGESTRSMLAAGTRSDARMLSVDVRDCSDVPVPPRFRDRWTFVQCDDVAFGCHGFTAWCETNGVPPRIDVLFIDTSHLYEHTVRELETWLPFVPVGGIVLLHDTNMREIYRRLNNRVHFGEDNDRGVIRALEEHLGRRYDETKQFVDVRRGWLVRHHPWASGLTYLKRIDEPEAGAQGAS
jgi:cephalosporin hydroxylase